MRLDRDGMRDFYDGEMAARAVRALPVEREQHVALFAEECVRRGLSRVVEVGCGAGRDGLVLAAAGLAYEGVDLSPVAAQMCRDLGLPAQEALATALPFADDAFDAGWTMSTLMHLEGDDVESALSELGRVVRPGGLLEVGIWGHDSLHEWVADDGRYFRTRTDAEVQELLTRIGEIEAFETWDPSEDGGHYQWARLVIG